MTLKNSLENFNACFKISYKPILIRSYLFFNIT